jgi:acyl-CoA reductase-like NAD-dependent aldehyde dehydrogenase
LQVKQRTTSGGLVINDCLMHLANHELPFGGVGTSVCVCVIDLSPDACVHSHTLTHSHTCTLARAHTYTGESGLGGGYHGERSFNAFTHEKVG